MFPQMCFVWQKPVMLVQMEGVHTLGGRGVCVFACVYLHVRLASNTTEDEIWSSGCIWVSRVQMGALSLPCGGIFKTVAHTLCYLPFVRSLLHHSTTGTLPNSLLCLLEPWQPAAHIVQLEKLLLKPQPIGLVLRFLARWDSKCAAVC